MKEEDRSFSLGAAAKMVGIPGYMLRQWCDRYLHHIKRMKIGEFQFQRRFTGQDIELIRRIKEYRQKGFTLGAAVTQARQNQDGEKE
jgi:DNA-binding transcriptional MerR regulator